MTLSVTGTCCLNSLSLSYHGYQLTRQCCVHSDLESEVGKEETLSNPDADVAAAAAKDVGIEAAKKIAKRKKKAKMVSKEKQE